MLNDYGYEIPKTWKELLETGQIIYKKEIEKGNTSLIGYNGLISGILNII